MFKQVCMDDSLKKILAPWQKWPSILGKVEKFRSEQPLMIKNFQTHLN